MKKSFIYFGISLIITLCTVIFPSLSGKMRLNRDGEPLDLLSKLWASGHKVALKKTYPDNIRVLKIEGNGHRASISLTTGENSYFSKDIYNFNTRVTNDTLFFDVSKPITFSLRDVGNLEKIILNNTEGYISVNQRKDNLALEINDGANINLFTDSVKNESFRIHKLQLNLQDKSTLKINAAKIQSIKADLKDAELNYSNELAADTVFVNLQGRSIVKSDAQTSVHELKTLIVQGNKQYFKEALVGKNVQLIKK